MIDLHVVVFNIYGYLKNGGKKMTKMKKVYPILMIGMLVFILAGCKGSKDIVGTWKATSPDESKGVIKITEKKITIKAEDETSPASYKQVAAGIHNGISYKGLEVDGEKYSIIFPKKKDKSVAFLVKVTDDKEKDTNYLQGIVVAVMSKDKYLNYEEYTDKYWVPK